MTQPDLARLAGLVERLREPFNPLQKSRVSYEFGRSLVLEEIATQAPELLARIAALEGCVRTIAEHKPISPALAHIVQMRRIARAALTLKENDDGLSASSL